MSTIKEYLKEAFNQPDVKGIKLLFSLALSDSYVLEKKDWNIEFLDDGLVATKKGTLNTNVIAYSGRLSYIHLIKK
ncbi:MAG: hypothetical protein HWN66_06455 [Candidatus Helarchaeota archaeon]|nr:hypothetical protein [Candidatus Helarchaeota archaeon]